MQLHFSANILDGFGAQYGGNYSYNQGQNYGYGHQAKFDDEEYE